MQFYTFFLVLFALACVAQAQKCQRRRFVGSWGFSLKANVLNPQRIVHRHSVGWQRLGNNGIVSGLTVGTFTNLTSAATTQAINGTWSLDVSKCQVTVSVILGGGRTATLKGYLESDGETMSLFQTDAPYKAVMRMKRLPSTACSLKKLRGKYVFAGVSNEHALNPTGFLGYDWYNGTENFMTYSEYNSGEESTLYPKVEVRPNCMIYWTGYGDSTAYAGVLVDRQTKFYYIRTDGGGFESSYGEKSL